MKSPGPASSTYSSFSPQRNRARPFTMYSTVSSSPWWWAPVLASGSTTTVPAHSFCAPAVAWVMAAARVMPGVCGVFVSNSPARTIRMPWAFQSISPCYQTWNGTLAVDGAPDRTGAVAGYPLLWPSARPCHSLLHRDVGAVQLLRDARHPDSVHGGSHEFGRVGFLRRQGRRGLRFLHGHGVSAQPAGRLGGRPHHWAAEGRAVRRNSDRRWRILAGRAGSAVVLSGAGAAHGRNWAVEAQRQHHRRPTLQAQRCAARFRLFHLLHGDQHRRADFAADLRVPRRAGQLAAGIRGGGRRHAGWPDSICVERQIPRHRGASPQRYRRPLERPAREAPRHAGGDW